MKALLLFVCLSRSLTALNSTGVISEPPNRGGDQKVVQLAEQKANERHPQQGKIQQHPGKNEEERLWPDRHPSITGLVGSIIGAVATLIGVLFGFVGTMFVLYKNSSTAVRVQKLQLKLKYVEEQLEKFYGPLLAECIESDGMFRRVELAMQTRGHQSHRHYDFRNLQPEHFKETDKADSTLPCEETGATADLEHCRLFAKMLIDVILPSNERRHKIIRNNLHLLGPAPPTSIYLFISHAAQLKSLIQAKRLIALPKESTPAATTNRYNDPYILTPFPAVMAGEIAGKVAYLKSLQREYQHRLSKTGLHKFSSLFDEDSGKKVFRRDEYYLLLPETLWEDLNRATDQERHFEHRNMDHRAFYPPSFPLVWGPYTAVELFELRLWLITRERILRDATTLAAEGQTYRAMLKADVVKVDRENSNAGDSTSSVKSANLVSEENVTNESRKQKNDPAIIPISHRVAQMFDELDDPGSKKNFPWNAEFTWETLDEKSKYYLKPFRHCGFQLHNIDDANKMAYYEDAYNDMRSDC